MLSVPEFDVSGASLQAGDRVTVLATFGAGSGQASYAAGCPRPRNPLGR